MKNYTIFLSVFILAAFTPFYSNAATAQSTKKYQEQKEKEEECLKKHGPVTEKNYKKKYKKERAIIKKCLEEQGIDIPEDEK